MAFSPEFGTGFEYGSLPIGPGVLGGVTDVSVTASAWKTGAYSLAVSRASWIRFDVAGTPSDIYVGLHVNHRDLWGQNSSLWIRVYLTSGHYVGLRWDATAKTYDAYVDGGKVADGSVAIPSNTWFNVQVRFNIDNAGSIESYVEGVADINYSGDTQPGGSPTINAVHLETTYGGGISAPPVVDDFVFGSGGFPGDIRFDVLIPNADTATEEWTRSAGVDSYALVDERPASDADYIYSESDGDQTIVTLTDWDSTDKRPEFVMFWARCKKDEAAAHQVKIIDSDGVDTNIGPAEDLLTTYTYETKLRTTAPDGGTWEDADIDALQIGVESVVV